MKTQNLLLLIQNIAVNIASGRVDTVVRPVCIYYSLLCFYSCVFVLAWCINLSNSFYTASSTAVPQKSSELPPGRNGHDILKEINRRLCFVEHYHTKGSPSVSFYDYVETFDEHNCFSNDTVTKCSVDAMKEVGAHHSKLQHCLQEDSVDEDIASGVMEKNLRHLEQKTLQEMPQIEIDGSPILEDNSDNNRKPFDSKTVFQAYCDAYHASDRLKDLVACNICLPCQDVRTCLWELKCDGKSLYEESDVIVTQPPGTENSNSSTANKDKSQSNTINNNDKGGRSGPNITFVIMACFVIALAACPAAFYLLRDIRNRKLMSEIDKTLTFADDSNHEGLPSETESNSYSDRDPVTGASRSVDLVDLVLANGSVSDNFEDAKQFELVKHPDDILEDESDWVENKRVTPNAHIC